MASQKILLAMVITAVGVFSVGKAQSDLPIVKEADCERIPLIHFKKCLIIEFKSEAPVVEYAGLDPAEDRFPNILNGQLYNSDLDEILDSMVTASIEKDGTTAEVLIRGSGQIGRLLQLKVNLESGKSEVDTVPKDPRFRFESESDESDDTAERYLSDEQIREVVSQYDMNREAIPTSLRMKVQIAIDGHFVENFGEEADEKIAGVFNHVQNFFLDPSLGMKFHLEKLEPIHLKEKFDVTTRDLDKWSDLVRKKVADGSMPGDADAYVLLSDSSKACVGGVSYLGWVYGEGVCGLTPDKRVTINWYKRDALSSALTVLHELGHALGMKHDWEKIYDGEVKYVGRKDSQGNSCSRKGGLMDYPEWWYEEHGYEKLSNVDFTDHWTTCSVEDFKATYMLYKNKDGHHCLEKRVDERQKCNGQDGVINLEPGKEVKIGPPGKPTGDKRWDGSDIVMYHDHERCLWEVKAPQGSYIRIEFESFNVENYCPAFKNPPSIERKERVPRVCPDAPCTHDYVSIYDGASKQSPRIAKACGPDVRAKHPSTDVEVGPYMSSRNAMAVEFHSGPRNNRAGFIAKLSVVNCGEIVYLNGTEYTLSVPSGLDKDSECVWTFIAPAEYNIIVRVDDVAGSYQDKKDTSECLAQYVPKEGEYRPLSRLCKGMKWKVRSQRWWTKRSMFRTYEYSSYMVDNIMELRLTGPGAFFTGAKVTAVDIPTEKEKKEGKLMMDCLPQNVALQEGTETFLTSPMYPEMLSKDNKKSTHCAWVLEAPKGHSIKITLEDFEFDNDEWCASDNLAIYMGRPTTRDLRENPFNSPPEDFKPMVLPVAKMCGSKKDGTAHTTLPKAYNQDNKEMEESYTVESSTATIHFFALSGSRFKVKVTTEKITGELYY